MSFDAISQSEELIILLHARDPRVLQYLYDFGPRLELSLRRKFIPYISEEDIRDIVCDGLIRAYQTGHRFDPTRAKLTTWLNQIVHYEALTFIRNHQYMDSTSLDQLADKCAASIEAGSSEFLFSPSSIMGNLLTQLKPTHEEVLRLHYYDGLSISRIAQLCGEAPGAIRTRLHRARHELKQLIISYRGDITEGNEVEIKTN